MITVSVPELKAGDIVHMSGGVFKINEDSRAAGQIMIWNGKNHVESDSVGDCAVTTGVCLSGEVSGYFKPGSIWNFQGNHRAKHSIEERQ